MALAMTAGEEGGEAIDSILDKMVVASEHVRTSQGSAVRLPKAEFELLGQLEVARDFMLEALTNQSDRGRLQKVFGGDCRRITQLRGLCESVELSAMNRGDQRVPTCLRACEAVERVLAESGDAGDLRQASTTAQVVIKGGKTFAAEDPLSGTYLKAGRISSAREEVPELLALLRRLLAEGEASWRRALAESEARVMAALETRACQHFDELGGLRAGLSRLNQRAAEESACEQRRSEEATAALAREVQCQSSELARLAALQRSCDDARATAQATVDELWRRCGQLEGKSATLEKRILEAHVKLDESGRKAETLCEHAEQWEERQQDALAVFRSELERRLLEVSQVQEPLSSDLDRLKASNASLWDSFNHFGSLIRKLEQGLKDQRTAYVW